jgi:BTB/POZ domain
MSGSDEVLDILDDPDADVILCSRDHRKFRVLKLYITKVSPVLRELIRSASTSHAPSPTSPLPSVQLSDSGATLSSLLTFILPVLPVLPSTPGHTMVLLSTAQKYQMDSILSRIRAMVGSQNPPFIRRETAFQVYYLARMHGLHQEALQAARTTLTFPFTFEDLEDQLETIHGIYLHELWKYYLSVRTHLKSDLEAFRATGMPALTCPPCSSESSTSHGTPIWLDNYVASIAESPAYFDLTEFHICFSRHIKTYGCPCSIPSKGVRAFWTDLTDVVHGSMRKVSLDSLRDCHTRL